MTDRYLPVVLLLHFCSFCKNILLDYGFGNLFPSQWSFRRRIQITMCSIYPKVSSFVRFEGFVTGLPKVERVQRCFTKNIIKVRDLSKGRDELS